MPLFRDGEGPEAPSVGSAALSRKAICRRYCWWETCSMVWPLACESLGAQLCISCYLVSIESPLNETDNKLIISILIIAFSWDLSSDPKGAVNTFNHCLVVVMGWTRTNKLTFHSDKRDLLLGSSLGKCFICPW